MMFLDHLETDTPNADDESTRSSVGDQENKIFSYLSDIVNCHLTDVPRKRTPQYYRESCSTFWNEFYISGHQ